MAGLRELRKRLKSIRTTGQLAGAMRTVAAAKYSRVNAARLSYETYAAACREMQRAAGRMGAAPAAASERRCPPLPGFPGYFLSARRSSRLTTRGLG